MDCPGPVPPSLLGALDWSPDGPAGRLLLPAIPGIPGIPDCHPAVGFLDIMNQPPSSRLDSPPVRLGNPVRRTLNRTA
ncbi:hypothetical protein Pen02_75550 [Plantactinospora endophytica]|uniref:Uncharacterized protein n=1 Tax=Plantactinospora endophytica TaxID=673535 RepID=A0ABQ4ED32_9ACTN|nr:hypothetical protein Pen02_75550 [Plantactinospora endophytica]